MPPFQTYRNPSARPFPIGCRGNSDHHADLVLIERLYFLQIVEHVRYRALSIENRFKPATRAAGSRHDLRPPRRSAGRESRCLRLEVVPEQVRDMALLMTWATQSLSLSEREERNLKND
ncbi:MAG: hypothetical protein CM1200mP41_09330 [Gammaproteobacteria bacterium]|nr:MAG: hypothetical protein CM1200mP41_09330 [Gammaproteobacteria bacterium]